MLLCLFFFRPRCLAAWDNFQSLPTMIIFCVALLTIDYLYRNETIKKIVFLMQNFSIIFVGYVFCLISFPNAHKSQRPLRDFPGVGRQNRFFLKCPENYWSAFFKNKVDCFLVFVTALRYLKSLICSHQCEQTFHQNAMRNTSLFLGRSIKTIAMTRA